MLSLNATDIYCFTMDYKQVDDGNLSPALNITVPVLVRTWLIGTKNFQPCLQSARAVKPAV